MPITKQTIAIIGAGGNMGSAIAKSIAGGNYRLLLFDSNPDQMGSLNEEILQLHPEADLELMNCPHESSWEADIIILAVPHGAEQELADKIRDVATQKIVISIANPIDEDISKLPDTSAAEEQIAMSIMTAQTFVNGALDFTFDDMEKLLGRRPTGLDTFIKQFTQQQFTQPLHPNNHK